MSTMLPTVQHQTDPFHEPGSTGTQSARAWPLALTRPSGELRQAVPIDEPLDSPGLVPYHMKRSIRGAYPILEILQRIIYRLQPGVTMNGVLGSIALYHAGLPFFNYLMRALRGAFASHISLSEQDPVAREILTYMAANVFSKSVWNTDAILASGNKSPESMTVQDLMLARYGGSTSSTDDLQFMPPVGTKLFWMGLRPFVFTRVISKKQTLNPRSLGVYSANATIHLWTLGWSLQPLRDFVTVCHDFKNLNAVSTTTVHLSSGSGQEAFAGHWRPVMKQVRKLDTIDMDPDVKADLVSDSEQYYSQETRNFYTDCGIPYRRGYLFYGPPGTGKTSFSLALAGHLKCDLYLINLAGGEINDGNLQTLFLSLPRKCVVVIEDIDSAGINRERKTDVFRRRHPPGLEDIESHHIADIPERTTSKSTVTLSGLLNAIDGNASQEGRLLIMTSNDPDGLDDALVRPGRIDKKVHFGNMTDASARNIFERLVGRAAVSSGTLTQERLYQKSTQFIKLFEPRLFTPAEVQNFLQECRGDAEKALDQVENWARSLLRSRGKASLPRDVRWSAVGGVNGVSSSPSNSPPMSPRICEDEEPEAIWRKSHDVAGNESSGDASGEAVQANLKTKANGTQIQRRSDGLSTYGHTSGVMVNGHTQTNCNQN